MKKAIIIGAGPAGLAAAHRLVDNGVSTVILERDAQVGGISRTVRYKGYYFDIGGHRFHTKNKAVLSWWQGLLPGDFRKVGRRSRIYYRQAFFDYPLTMANVFAHIGPMESLLIALSYCRSHLFPFPDESGFEQWIINRFGRKLYGLFFKEYTHKVWGVEGGGLSADVAEHRIKGLSLFQAARNALSRGRNNTIKTLISEFYFPRLGCGMMYEAAASRIAHKGGQLMLQSEVSAIKHNGSLITSVVCKDIRTGRLTEIQGSDFCSSMPLTYLVLRMEPAAPPDIREACRKLKYRSIVLVNCIVDRKDVCADNWIYIHSSDVKVARIQNFKNWSPDMLPDQDKTALGLEYFCDEGDEIWVKDDRGLLALAAAELERLKLCAANEVIDGCVVRAAKTYPIYETGYSRHLDAIRKYVGRFTNLHCMGRYGMFRYNGMDHSVLTGFLAAENVMGKHHDLWPVSVETWDD